MNRRFIALLLFIAVILGVVTVASRPVAISDMWVRRESQFELAQAAHEVAQETGLPYDAYVAKWYDQQTSEVLEIVVDGQLRTFDEGEMIALAGVVAHESGIFSIEFDIDANHETAQVEFQTISGLTWYVDTALWDGHASSTADQSEATDSSHLPDPPMTEMVLAPLPHVDPWSYAINGGLFDQHSRRVYLVPGEFVEDWQDYRIFRHSDCPQKVWVTDGQGNLWDVTQIIFVRADDPETFSVQTDYMELPLDWKEGLVADPTTACQ